MQVSKEVLGPTSVKLTISGGANELAEFKKLALARLGNGVKLPGFRAGKAPADLLEKNLNQAELQNEFLQEAVNQLFAAAAAQEKLRPVAPPEVNFTKFVPFTTLEFTANVEVVGEVKLANYKQIKLAKPKVNVTAADVNEVIEQLRTRTAERKEINRPAKSGDEVTIDFSGSEADSGKKVNGADGKDYPLVLGSNQFIPGFENNLVGLKTGEEKTFKLIFPADYGVRALAKKAVNFNVNVKKVNEIVLDKLDDNFAKKVGPFNTLQDLRADVKNQLRAEREQQNERAYENELIEKVAEKSEVAIPNKLIDEELAALENQERQNLAYRGQTWQEHLEAEGITEEQHKTQNRPAAEKRVRAGLVLSEIAEKEGLQITNDELETRIKLLKDQYGSDAKMQAELAKPAARRDIAARMLTEKTIEKLAAYASS